MAQVTMAAFSAAQPRRPWLTHNKVAVLFYASFSSILIQNLLFGSRKMYASIFETEISIFDGILPTALAVLFLLFGFKGKVGLGLFRAVSPLWPFAAYLIGSILLVGFVGKGFITLVQCLIQLLFLYYGYAYASENEGNPQRILTSVCRIFASVAGLLLLSDIIYTQLHGFIVQVGSGLGRYNTSFGTYVLLGYFASLQFLFWGGLLLGRGLREGKGKAILAFCFATLMVLVSGARTAAWSALLALLLNAVLMGRKRRILLILVASVLLALLASWYGLELRFVSTEGGTRLSLNVDLTGRESWYRDVWESACEHPIFGSGWGSADKLVLDLRKYIYSTHSQHLQIFHDLGGAGYLLFLFGWSLLVVRLWRASRRFPEKSLERFWTCMGMAFLVQVFISMATDSVWVASLYFGNFGYFLVGIALRYGRRRRRSRNTLIDLCTVNPRPPHRAVVEENKTGVATLADVQRARR